MPKKLIKPVNRFIDIIQFRPASGTKPARFVMNDGTGDKESTYLDTIVYPGDTITWRYFAPTTDKENVDLISQKIGTDPGTNIFSDGPKVNPYNGREWVAIVNPKAKPYSYYNYDITIHDALGTPRYADPKITVNPPIKDKKPRTTRKKKKA